ncbi:hypothetical protein LSAT2_030199 [Lamellibrachia satsuma]|nr:hypothetical protein LSAT2_030199 [Lamellibrachia satsuma]
MGDSGRKQTKPRTRMKDGVRRTVSFDASTKDDYLVCETMGESKKKRHSQSDVSTRCSTEYSLSCRRLAFRKRTRSFEERDILEELGDAGCQNNIGGMLHRKSSSNLAVEEMAVHSDMKFAARLLSADVAGDEEVEGDSSIPEAGQPYRYVVELNCGKDMATTSDGVQSAQSIGQSTSRTQWRTGNYQLEPTLLKLTSSAIRKQCATFEHRYNLDVLRRWVLCLCGYTISD